MERCDIAGTTDAELDAAMAILGEHVQRAFRPLSKFGALKRAVSHWWQRRTRGFSDDVTWSLDAEMSRFIAPRLRRFAQLNNVHPPELTEAQWDEILGEMVWSFEFLASEQSICSNDAAAYERADRGLALFAQWFRYLWW